MVHNTVRAYARLWISQSGYSGALYLRTNLGTLMSRGGEHGGSLTSGGVHAKVIGLTARELAQESIARASGTAATTQKHDRFEALLLDPAELVPNALPKIRSRFIALLGQDQHCVTNQMRGRRPMRPIGTLFDHKQIHRVHS